jgi:hypothetical protein
MKCLARNSTTNQLVAVLVLATTAALSACSTAEPPTEPNNGGTTGSSGGRGGSKAGGASGSAGSGGSSNPGTGGVGTNPGTGGSGPAAGAGGGTPAGGAGGSESPDTAGPVGDAPVTPGTGGSTPPGTGGSGPPPMSGTCDYTPKANATSLKVKFDPIAIPGVPITEMGKSNTGPSVMDGITMIKFIPGKPGEFLLVQKRGRVSHMKLDGADAKSATLVKSFNVPGVNGTADCGLLAMAFDPDFKTNNLIYFGFCTGPRASKLSRFTLVDDTPTDGVEIMNWDGATGKNAWHSVGSAGFDPMGNLWMMHGEFNSDSPGDTAGSRAQSLDTNLGKLVRIIPSRVAGMGGYTLPSDNPYATDANKKKAAIYAYGFRSPWRAIMTSKGHWIIGDVGNTTNEEIDVVVEKNKNYGWSTTSGMCSGACTSPVTYWRGRGNNEPYDGEGNAKLESSPARAVWVGTQYGDCGNDKYGGAMTGVTTFGDFFAGWVHGLVVDDKGAMTKDASLVPDSTGMGSISSMDQGTDGYLYMTTFGTYGGDLAGSKPALFRVLPM